MSISWCVCFLVIAEAICGVELNYISVLKCIGSRISHRRCSNCRQLQHKKILRRETSNSYRIGAVRDFHITQYTHNFRTRSIINRVKCESGPEMVHGQDSMLGVLCVHPFHEYGWGYSSNFLSIAVVVLWGATSKEAE